MSRTTVPEEDLEPIASYHDYHDHDHYGSNTVKWIQAVYIIALLLWVVLIVGLGLVNDDYISLCILLLPPIVYIINFVSLKDFTCKYEDQMFRGNFLSFAFLVAIVLIHWNNPISNQDKTEFFKILIVAFTLLMISLLDVWVSGENMSIMKHIKTCLQTASLTLLTLGLYLYYTFHRNSYSLE